MIPVLLRILKAEREFLLIFSWFLTKSKIEQLSCHNYAGLEVCFQPHIMFILPIAYAL